MHRLPFLLAILTSAAAQAQGAPGDGFQVERYAVALRPDLASTAVNGTQTIDLRATVDRVTRLAFSPNALRISDATADGTPLAVASGKDAIVFALPKALRKGARITLRFRIAGTPARGVTALPGGVYSGYFACDWMVCLQDVPGDKAHLLLDLHVPAGLRTLGNGRAQPPEVMPDGLVRHRWRTTRPYSPYLYAFAAGRFARRVTRTPHGELLLLDATGEPADSTALFAQTSAAARFFAGKAGVPLPDGRYAQLLVPGHEAQEAAGFSLVGSAEIARERDDPGSEWLIAHELAHQWWGNLVTCATWRDFWLNEGIVTFMVAAWKQQERGEAAYQRELETARQRLVRAREEGFDKPLAWGGNYPSLRTRRAVQYGKGALFLAHLRATIGDAPFWAGLRDYTRRHAGGTVVSRDFQTAMERASRRDLSAMFADWVYGGVPPRESAAGLSGCRFGHKESS